MSDWLDVDVRVSARSGLTHGDQCRYRHKFHSRGGFSAPDGNQVISNFKIGPEFRNQYRWTHKLTAIRQFAADLTQELAMDSTIAFIPSSKKRDHEKYDNRFDLLGKELKSRLKRLIIEEPIIRTVSVDSAHEGGEKLDFYETLDTLEWVGFDDDAPDRIFLIDDVMTRGTSYKACKHLISKNEPDVEVCGLFWGLTVWPKPEGGFGLLDDDD